MDFKPISEIPLTIEFSKKLLWLKDDKSIIHKGYANIYNWNIINKEIITCEPYFCGFMIDVGFDLKEIGEITHFKEVN